MLFIKACNKNRWKNSRRKKVEIYVSDDEKVGCRIENKFKQTAASDGFVTPI